MARPQNSPILAQLRNAKSLPEQRAALQALKNEIVGHVQKKEAWIGLGVLEPIVRTLSSSRPPEKLNGKDASVQLWSRPLSDEDSIKLQGLQLIASFANGGPAFLHPLHAARVVPAVLGNISPYTNPPQVVVSSLRALLDITSASDMAASPSALDVQSIADNVFTSQHIASLNAVLSMASPKYIFQSQVFLASTLIGRLCRQDRHQHALTMGGILDSLAAQLARFAVADGLVVPGAEEHASSDGLYDLIPEPANPGAKIGPILEAVSCIIGSSKYRANRLICSPSILATFPSIKFEPYEDPRDSQQAVPPRHDGLTAMEFILPSLPITASRTPSAAPSSFPTPDRSDSRTSSRTSLSKLGSSVAWDSPRFQALGNTVDVSSEDIESPFIPWLIHLVRSLSDYERLMAAAVLAALFKAGLGRRGVREASIGLLVVPILVGMIAKNDRDGDQVSDSLDTRQLQILEKAPAILARTITDSEYLQKAAIDCDAVKVLTRLLKRAYQPVENVKHPKYWSPSPDTGMDVESTSPLAQLGDGGQNPLLVHRIRVRESALKAIGALSAGKEDYRKALVAEDFVPFVVESLGEFPRKPKQAKDKPVSDMGRTGPTPAYGTNPQSVLIAGCHVVRTLARSVGILRTALVDHAVAMPVFRFMRHPDINVQIAATATIINLVVEVSPVREVGSPLPLPSEELGGSFGADNVLEKLLTESGVMKVLCEHAHSDNHALRLNALWALKHLVDAVGPALKKACLEQLQPGWLMQLICDDDRENCFFPPTCKEPATDDLDEDMDMQQSDERLRWLYGTNGAIRELDASRSSRLRQVEDRLASVREAEVNPARKTRNESLAMQEQGLDFIRNLIGRPESDGSSEVPSESTEMIDHLLRELGQARLFEMLASKLRSKVLHPFSRRAPVVGGRETRVLHPQAKIIVAVICILVHMAASIPRHRQLVIAQTELLKLLAQQANSKDRSVRASLCHLVINLTWQEDEGEAQACSQRAQELKRLGFYSKMETLRQQDRDLDVRERAKTAAWQIDQVTC
ncbi:armadillo repeat protein [Metarhizium album ARSEF 1941]|uniref:Armadillo repeat protein n=1 Tax=Metarhizium album (strain ARSEF 1941) TaxID=1081103 RepID=A0A0B2WXH3_METAS|nr:armadillo repeat protein [Metarhizium album ARSEF 1941]KHN98249.1 armadillo repeat protein [Metarhizium album ARSEF 1941]